MFHNSEQVSFAGWVEQGETQEAGSAWLTQL
jgi:hypothetical protein